jgi:hypothetical protein
MAMQRIKKIKGTRNPEIAVLFWNGKTSKPYSNTQQMKF